jgi:alpha-maltose-1-phosphate synthase
VDHLCSELMRIGGDAHRLQVLCFGNQQETGANVEIKGIAGLPMLSCRDGGNRKVIDVLGRNIAMAGEAEDTDIVHCHTWYTYLAGCLVKQFMDVPLIITVHCLEPLRPWKREQIGTGYNVSSWLEKTALENADGVIAVSQGMKTDILRLYDVAPEKVRVVYNGIDAQRYREVAKSDVLISFGIDPLKPTVLFVGRITRQKGIIHLVRALPHIEEGTQIVLCTGALDTQEIADKMRAEVERAPPAYPTKSSGFPRWCPWNALYRSTAMPPSSFARRSTSASESSTWKRWPAEPPWSPLPWAESRKWCWMGKPAS